MFRRPQRSLACRRSQARASYLLARLHAERGELRTALGLVEQARSMWLRAQEPLSALRTDLGRMQILDDLGRHADAVATGEALLAGLEVLDAVPGGQHEHAARTGIRADALGNVGVAYSFLGEHERSLEAYAASEQLYLDLGATNDTAKPLANRGIELLALGRPREALSALRSAHDIFVAMGDRIWSAKCAGHIGQAHLRMGQLIEALAVLEPAARTLRDLGVTGEAVRLELTIASVHLYAGLHDEAAAAAADVVERTRDAGMVHDCAFATLTLALAELGAARLDRAAAQLDVARTLFEQVARPPVRRSGTARVRRGRRPPQGPGRSTARGRGRRKRFARAGGSSRSRGRTWWPRTPRRTTSRHWRASAAATPLIDELGLPGLRFELALRLGRVHRRQGAVDRVGRAPAPRDRHRRADGYRASGPDPPDRLPHRQGAGVRRIGGRARRTGRRPATSRTRPQSPIWRRHRR